jgi:hypothetical protein
MIIHAELRQLEIVFFRKLFHGVDGLETRNDDPTGKLDELPMVLNIFTDFLVERVIVGVIVGPDRIGPAIAGGCAEIFIGEIAQGIIFGEIAPDGYGIEFDFCPRIFLNLLQVLNKCICTNSGERRIFVIGKDFGGV